MKKYEFKTDQWYVSHINAMEETRSEFSFPEKILVADCTLRDGEQQPGIVYRKDEKVLIAQQLDKLGVDEIELSMPIISQDDKEATEKIISLGLKAKISIFSRALEEDIDVAASVGAWGVRISLPAGDLQRSYKIILNDDEYISKLLHMVEYAKKKDLNVKISPYDTTRTNLDFLDRVLQEARKSGCVDGVRAVDTVAAATPESIKYLVKRMKRNLGDIPIEIHCHNDFGLAVANTIAGLQAGANIISSTVNGFGERCGNAPIEEVAVALKVLYGVDLNLDYALLKETSDLVAQYSGITLQPNKAVVGKHCFAHESGLAVAGMAKMHFLSEAYVPEMVGQKSSTVIGKKSGKKSIEIKMEQFGYKPVDSQCIDRILSEAKDFSIMHKRNLSDDELRSIIEKAIQIA